MKRGAVPVGAVRKPPSSWFPPPFWPTSVAASSHLAPRTSLLAPRSKKVFMLATDLRTYAFDLEVDSIDYRSPMKFGGRVVEGVQIVSLRCRAENGAGQQGDGLGSMTMGNAWAWPSQQLTSAQTLEATVALAKEIAEDAAADPLGGHPLDISLALAERRQGLVERVTERLGLPERFPPLAVLL